MKTRRKVLTIVVVVVATLFFVLPGIVFSILNWGILPPDKLTPLVVEQANKYLDANLECERIELTFFETYPHLGVKITNGRLVSHVARDSVSISDEKTIVPSDSLLAFRKAVVSLRPLDYLFLGRITVGEFRLEEPHFHGYVNDEGIANWNIYTSESDSSTENNNIPLPAIDLRSVRISDGHFGYYDSEANIFTEIEGFFLNIDGSLTNGKNTLDIETGTSSILFNSEAYTLKNDLSLKLKSRIFLSDNYNTISLKEAELRVNNFPFTADGSISRIPEVNQTKIDMDFGLKVSDLNDLMDFIPETYLKNKEKIHVEGTIDLDGDIHGYIGDSIVPSINLCCKVDNGAYHMDGMKQGIDTLKMDLDLHLSGIHPDSSFVSLEQLILKGLTTSLDMSGKVTNLQSSPTVSTTIKGKVDFTRLAEEFLNPDTLLIGGAMEANLSAAFCTDDVLNGKYGKVFASGNLSLDTLKVFSKPLGTDVFITNAVLSVDSAQRGSSAYRSGKNPLGATLSIDSMRVKYQDDINTNISRLTLKAKTSPIIDTSAVIPLSAEMKFNHLRTRLPDSVWLAAGQTVATGSMKPSASNKHLPSASISISVDTLRYFILPMRTGVVLAGNAFNIEALPYKDVLRQRRQTRKDTTKVHTPRSKKEIKDIMTIKAKADTTSQTSKLLSHWEARGSLSFNSMRGFSRLMPLPIKTDRTTTIKFNTSNVTLSDARLHIGKSDLTLSGEVKRIRQALLRGGKLKGDFSLTSDHLDCNQLMNAMNSGMQYWEQHATSTDSLTLNEEELVASMSSDSISSAPLDTTGRVFVVPSYLDVALHTNAKKIEFKDVVMENVLGEVIIRDQSIDLSNLKMDSNIGNGNMTMFYTAKDDSGASTGFDLDLEGIQVEKLIGLYPAIDTLIPMLRSFEGIVDCQLTATCNIDSTMSLDLSSINSACFLHGKNMVLLDGETFTEISKTLMFKNKKRNMIDSISVDLAIKDNKIEVFPFLIEMDRYKVAVGGTHNLDMTFNYHLSVLKSPVPFKLGIDITGNLDKFKYKIVKCRYKDLFKPVKESELDSTRTNIRKELRESIRRQIKETAPELVSSLPSNLPSVEEKSLPQ